MSKSKLFSGIILFLFLSCTRVWGQSVDDFQTHQSGNWDSTSTWERWDGTSWVSPAPAVPSSIDGVITILNTHIITLSANHTVDQCIVNVGGEIAQNAGDTLTVANGTGTDLTVSGTFVNAGTVVRNASATIAFNSGAVYQHTGDGGTIPTATWSSGSTCLVSGTVAALPGGLNQAFGSLTWNCSAQTVQSTIGNTLTVAGTLTIQSTGGSGQFRFASGTSTVTGDFVQSGGWVRLSGGSTRTVSVGGNFTMSGGTLEMADGTNTGAVNVAGNYSQSGGTIQASGGSTTSGFVFNGTGTQTFTSGGTVSNSIDYTVAATSTLQVNSGSTLVLNSGATLNIGTSLLIGGGNLTLSPGSTIDIGSPNGIAASAGTGNIQVSGTRTYSTGANYAYTGTSVQVTGDGLPATVNSLTINNAAGVTLGNSVAVSANLSVSVGKFTIGAFTVNRTASGGTLTVANGATLTIGGTNGIPSNYATHTLGGTSTVEYGGANQGVSAESYGNLLLSGSGVKTFAAGTTNIAGNFTLAAGVTADATTNYVTVNYNGTGAQTVAAINYSNLTLSGARTTNSITLSSAATIGIAGLLNPAATFSTGGYVVTGSTVNYNGAGAQSVAAMNYASLTLSNSGTKTMPAAALSVNGSFVLAGSVSASAGGPVTVTGNFSVGSGTSYNAGSFTHKVAGNWSSLGSFSAGTSTFIMNGTSAQTKTGAVMYNLTVSNPAGVTLQGSNETVADTLTLSAGNVTTGADTLTLGTGTSSPGALAWTSGTIVGSFSRWITAATVNNILFATGTASHFCSANVSFTVAPSAGGTLTATFTPSNPGSAGVPLNDAGTNIVNVSPEGFWTLTAGNGLTGGVYSLDITAAGFSGVSDSSTLRILQRVNGSNPWTLDGSHSPGTGSIAAPVAHRTGMSGFGDYGIGGASDNALPIQLASFSAAPLDGGKVRLEWHTISEVNNYGFDVQRRGSNETQFVTLPNSFVPGHGTTSLPNTYVFVDSSASPGSWAYRIKQTDLNGNVRYADAVTATVAAPAVPLRTGLSQNYPNPFNPSTTIAYTLAASAHVTLIVFNSLGQRVGVLVDESEDAGVHEVRFDGSALSSGVYYYHLQAGNVAQTKRLLLLK